jgi:hypothetical protein
LNDGTNYRFNLQYYGYISKFRPSPGVGEGQGAEAPGVRYNNSIMQFPTKVPEKGFYYHYKHDPNGPVNMYAYELIGTAFDSEAVGFHSEKVDDFLRKEVVVYKPLYKDSLTYKSGRDFWTRAVSNFTENVTKDGRTFPRFQKIIDEQVIKDLEKIRDEMYLEKI